MIASAHSPNELNNGRAMQLTGRNYLSVSAVKQFLRCPLSYRFKYIDRIPEDTVSSALAFGRGIHAALELWFTAQLEGQPEPTLEELLSSSGTNGKPANRRQPSVSTRMRTPPKSLTWLSG